MNGSSEIADIFRDWYMSELASHYAEPCPDEVMDHLVDVTVSHAARLAAQPATNAADLLLKAFPLLLASYEPKSGDQPLVPVFGKSNGSSKLLWSVVDDLRRVCPIIAEAMQAPNMNSERAAA